MKASKIITLKHMRTSTWLNVVALSIATLFVLFAIEATQPFNKTTERAFAWHCEMMKATPSTIEVGESTTLSWKFSADSNVTVTVDQLAGQVWEGTTGSAVVSPKETTTYRAVAHKLGTTKTYECTTNVTVLPKAPSCDDISLTVSERSFSISGSEAQFAYTVEFCGDSSPSAVSGTLTNVRSVSFDKEIYRVHAEGDGCVLQKERTCAPPPVKIQPKVPDCPFDENDTSLVVVNFNGGKERNDSTIIRSDVHSGYEISKPLTLSAGVYTVYTASWDGYLGREKIASQPKEIWNVSLRNGNEVLGSVGPTTDIKDYVVEDMKTDQFTEALTLKNSSQTITLTHAAHFDATSYNSVVPVCVAFKKKPVEIKPNCEMTVNPKSIHKGETAILSWAGQHISSVHIPGVGDALSPASSVVVTPNETTTYHGTFYTSNEGTLKCSTTVTVTPKPADSVPVCAMSITPSTVNRGETATLTWTSSNTTSGTITQGIGTVGKKGSQSIVVNGDTVYAGTWVNEKGESVTCNAEVKVTRISGGGAGPCLNCDTPRTSGGSTVRKKEVQPEPSIVLGKNITKTQSFITLDQVPYTGFEAGPFLTAFFWVVVLTLSVTIAYFVTRFRPLEKIMVAISPRTMRSFKTDSFGNMVSIDHAPIGVSGYANFVMSAGGSDGLDSTAQIEELAHGQNILLSPEALRIIHAHIADDSLETLPYLTKLFEKAKADFPREDGWILLSKERVESIVENQNTQHKATQKQDTSSSRMGNGVPSNFSSTQQQDEKKNQQYRTAAEPEVLKSAHGEQQTTSPSSNIVLKFVDTLVRLEKKATFDLLRSISARGVDVGTFMTLVIRQLDEVYKARLEGNRTPEVELVQKTASWDNEDFETVLGILVECVDYSYSSNQIGTKIALAKAFEHFEKK